VPVRGPPRSGETADAQDLSLHFTDAIAKFSGLFPWPATAGFTGK
jgi:hypothetical protein